jgi:hypothetical protein
MSPLCHIVFKVDIRTPYGRSLVLEHLPLSLVSSAVTHSPAQVSDDCHASQLLLAGEPLL